ncbi:YveK family protein [Clostridium thermarum]|uniref:YveK family protein n=1 Tax=Clostridium thermarum TaxID=1716543 RepID=UPI0011226B11|nr:Wzz/FepE/Etk N-terminal domain-containing protein [Clostridium thermarum]
MEIKEYINILKKRFLLIVVITLLSTFTSAVFSYLIIKPTYKADISVIIGKKEDSQATNYNYNDVMMYQKLVKTYSIMTTSRTVVEDVIEKQNLDLSIGEVQKMISVSPKGDTQFLTITVKSKNAETAQIIANQLAKSLKEIGQDVLSEDNVHILDEALLPTSPDSPKPLLNTAIAFFLGMMVSIGLVFLLEYLDNTVKTQEDIERLIGVPVIGIIPLVQVEE